jgi:hypothetical protein
MMEITDKLSQLRPAYKLGMVKHSPTAKHE